jgi:hypothetical protein
MSSDEILREAKKSESQLPAQQAELLKKGRKAIAASRKYRELSGPRKGSCGKNIYKEQDAFRTVG